MVTINLVSGDVPRRILHTITYRIELNTNIDLIIGFILNDIGAYVELEQIDPNNILYTVQFDNRVIDIHSTFENLVAIILPSLRNRINLYIHLMLNREGRDEEVSLEEEQIPQIDLTIREIQENIQPINSEPDFIPNSIREARRTVVIDLRRFGGEKKSRNTSEMRLIQSFENNEITKQKNIEYYFPEDDTKYPVTFIKSDLYAFESVNKAVEFGFNEDLETMSWYKEGFNTPKQLFTSSLYFRFNNSSFSEKSKTFLLTEGKEYTFGVEFECGKLYLPQYVYKDLNVDCVRDGSLNEGTGGPEIVTGVLNGDSGLRHLQTICKELTSRGTVNKSCGLHLHLGGIDFSKANLVELYKICCILEEEIMETVPPSRKGNTYCKPLTKLPFESDIINQDTHTYKLKLNSDLELLVEHIKYDSKGKKHVTRKGQHPMGPKCGYNHETPRYCWVNFVPAVFATRESEKAKSIEIRIHPGTTSYRKTKNWLLLWMGVLWFIENKKEEIKQGLTINDILHSAYPKRGGKIADYFRLRKELFRDPKAEAKEYQEEVEPIKSIKDQL